MSCKEGVQTISIVIMHGEIIVTGIAFIIIIIIRAALNIDFVVINFDTIFEILLSLLRRAASLSSNLSMLVYPCYCESLTTLSLLLSSL